MTSARSGIFASFLLFAISLYRRILSPVLPAACRFHPTCSQYADDAVRTHGALRGSWLAIRRVARCHPFNEGGIDPVPHSALHDERRV